jgi:general nucleoside transport system permease protein
MTTTTHDIVTLDTLRGVSKRRAFGYGVAIMVLGLMEVLWYGGASSALKTTVQFGYNSATVMPTLGATLRVIVLVIGVGLVAASLLVARGVGRLRLPKALVVVAGLVGAYFVIWPMALWLGVNDAGALRTATMPTWVVGYIFGALSLVAGAVLVWKRFDRGASALLYAGLLVFLLGFLVWVARGSDVSGLYLQFTSILAIAVGSATFLMFGSLAGTICERAGVVNIAIEGQFMAGGISSIVFASALHGTGLSKTLAVLVAGLFGALFGWVLAVMALRYQANQVIVGVVIVAFCTALTQFLMSQVFTLHQDLDQSGIALPVWQVPFLSKIPVLGPTLFDQNILVFVAFGAVIVANAALFRTRWGLRVRSVGEKPVASETVGINVVRMRYGAVMVGGFIAGVGGAAFTLGPGLQYVFGITSGYGYIALAIMIFGRWRPYGAMMASLLFGFSIALASTLNIYQSQLVIPQQFISALPYLITIAVVSGLVGKIRPPAADGVPFRRE